MKKRVFYILLLAGCLLLALQMSAFAAEVPQLPVVEVAPAALRTESEPALRLFGNRATAWAEDSECYGDQLRKEVQNGDGELHDLYRKMKAAFEKEEVLFDGVNKRWVTPTLAEQRWSVQQYVDAYGTEMVEYNGQSMQAWNAEILKAANAWITSYDRVLWDVADTFLADHPEYFWLRTDGGRMGAVQFLYEEEALTYCAAYVFYGFLPQPGCSTVEDRDRLQVQMDIQVAELMMATEEMSDVQKVAYWDNWLASQNAYNNDALATGIEDSCLPWSAASGLLPEIDPVCEGYAKALQLLCKKAGIPCVQLSGLACNNLDEPEEDQHWEAHMWTAVKLDDAWYFCDPTWNDPTITIEDEAGNILEVTEYDYSSREHLLTVQPESHFTQAGDLGVPELSEMPYVVEFGTGEMFLVLYDADGKMLDLGFCESIQWSENENLYLAPVFDADDLAQAARIVRINVNGGAPETFNWSPLTELKPIREPSVAE